MRGIFDRAADRTPPSRDVPADVLRGLATVLVVFGHANRGVIASLDGTAAAQPLRVVDFLLYATHMPAFFLLAGYFAHDSLRRRTTAGYARSRVRGVVYPYLLWSLIFVAAHLAAGPLTHINHPLGLSDLARIGWAPIHILWFLYVLAILELAALALRHAPRAVAIAAAVIAVTIYLGFSGGGGMAGRALDFAPFFFTGYLAAALGRPALEPALARAATIAAAGVGFGIVAWITLDAVAGREVQAATLPLSALGVALLGGVSLRLARSRAAGVAEHVAWIGRSSMQVYLIHIFVLALVPRLLAALSVQPPLAVTLAVSTLAGVYGSLLVAAILAKMRASRWLGLRHEKSPRRTTPPQIAEDAIAGTQRA